MNIPFNYPPELSGTTLQQLQQLWDWAWQLVEQLNLMIEEEKHDNG